MYEQYLYI